MKKLFATILTILIMVSLIFISLKEVYASDNFDFLSEKTETIYDSESGLLTGRANDIKELENGCIFIGQYSGLTRYDGSIFTTYYGTDEIDLTSVSCLEALGNTLFIGTQHGLITLDGNTFNKVVLSSNQICINDLFLYDSNIYIATNNGLYKYNGNTYIKLNNSNVTSVSASSIGYVYIDQDGNAYDNTGVLISSSVKKAYLKDNNIYLGKKDGTLLINNETVDITSSKPINDILCSGDTIYIASDIGLYIYEDGRASKVQGLKLNENIENMMIDYQGNLWLASSTKGISKITTNQFTDLFFKYNLNPSFVTRVNYYNDNLYIGTESGLDIIDENLGVSIENDLTVLLDQIRIRDIAVFNNKIYIATYDTNNTYAVIVYDGENISYINSDMLVLEGEVNTESASQVRNFTVMNNALYIGTNYGITKYDGSSFETVKSTRPLYLYNDGEYIYACLDKGGGLQTYDSDLNLINTIIGSEGLTVLKCLKTEYGLLYTSNAKLFLYDGLESREINLKIVGSIFDLFINDDHLYLGTDIGLYVMEKEDINSDDIVLTTYDKSLGLKSAISSNATGYYDEVTKDYYFCASDTAYKFSLNSSKRVSVPLKIGIKDIVVDGKTYNSNSIKVDRTTQRITFNISYYNYLSKNNYKVYYQLIGYDGVVHETEIQSSQTINYMNLNGGKYTFKLYAKDDYGTYSLNTIEISVVKEKKFFENLYVIIISIILLILILSGIVFLIIKLAIRRSIKKQEEYKEITLESIEAIARTIDAKDTYTNGHSLRVGKYSRLIAKHLGISGEELENIYYIALLHDIGKIAIPDSILNKPGKLTDEEFEIMKSHTTRGAKILESISTIPHIVEGAKYHHEKYDGRGYPEHIKGEEIPYIARIICCADCFDAMATKRVYKEPYESERIISEFEKGSGLQFDPNIAKVVVELIKNGILVGE